MLTSNKRPFSQDPDGSLLGTFIESSTWLSQHQHILESLRENYKKSSPLFQNVIQDICDLKLSGYDSELTNNNSLTVTENDACRNVKNINDDETPEQNNPIGTSSVSGASITSKINRGLRNQNEPNLQDVLQVKMDPELRRSQTWQNITGAGGNPKNSPLIAPKYKGPDFLHRSMRKPPATSISNINVLTKVTNLNLNEYKPITNMPKPILFRHFLHETDVKTLQTAKADLKNGFCERTSILSEAPKQNYEQDPDVFEHSPMTQEGAWKKDIKPLRRRSVVGRNLPLYIHKQIKYGDTEEIPISEDLPREEAGAENDVLKNSRAKSEAETAKDATKIATASKNTTHDESLQTSLRSSNYPSRAKNSEARLNNLLENSHYLYHQNQRNHHDSEISQNSISGSGHIDSAISDGDKEYVLPCMFTRSLEDFDVNVTYENFDSELQHEGVFDTLKNNLDDPHGSDGEENIANDYDSEDMRLYR